MNTTILWVCTAIAAAVFAVMLYSVARFRAPQSGGPANYKRHAAAEVLWAIVPIVILVAMAVPAVKAIVAPEAAHIADGPVRAEQRLSSLQGSEE
jgi:cytochrome c oxidase subunit II